MGIILEDDCLPSASFFLFCQELLIKYQLDRRIWHICGTSFIHADDLQDSSYYFSAIPNIWGWATWRDRWAQYDFYMEKYEGFLRHKYLNGIIPNIMVRLWHEVLFKKNAGKTVNWDSQWYFAALINHGLCATPKINLVKNIGFNLAETTNYHGADPVLSAMTNNELEFPLIHPQFFCVDYRLDHRYYKWRLGKFVLLKIILQPIRRLDEELFNNRLIGLYRRFFAR